jgi:ferredoxin
MKVSIDEDCCIATGACVLECPEVFDQDDVGTVRLRLTVVPPDLRARAYNAMAACPASVITVDEDT